MRSFRPPALSHWAGLVIASSLTGALAAMAWAEQKRTRSGTVKHWLVTIAELVELWPTLHADDLETAHGATTPPGAVTVMVCRDVPRGLGHRSILEFATRL